MDRGAGKRRSRGWRWLLVPLLLVLILTAIGAALAWRPAIAPLSDGPGQASGTLIPLRFEPALVTRGASLAAIGNCQVCHSATPAQPFAGGLGLKTPFGTVYSSNITPDRQTGIGAWSEPAFVRAMRDGVSRDGHLLYPVFPYEHFMHLADGDLRALYAYIMTREPLPAPQRPNQLAFPFNLRPLLAGWNLLFLEHGAVASDPGRGAEWNRGAYLAGALGHCGACHTPRNGFGAEDRRRYLGGGEAEGWYVPALNADTPSPTPWTLAHLTAYLRTGIAPGHAIAAGPMQSVAASLSRADENDVRAIAVYILSQMGTAPAAREAGAVSRAATPLPAIATAQAGDDAQLLQAGAVVYGAACARCHDAGRQDGSAGALQLPLAVALYDPDPRSLLHIIRDGVTPSDFQLDNQPGRWMPGFATELSDEQVIALAAYLRRDAANLPPWPDLPGALRKASTP